MYSFEGDFRRKPQQNLGGASSQRKTDRDALLLQLQQQRQKREEHRKRLVSTIKIQAFTRSYLTRKHCKQYERDDFDNMFPSVSSDDLQKLSNLTAKLLFFFDEKQDLNRLVALSQLLLKQQHYSWNKLFQNAESCIQMRRLLFLHLRLLRANAEMSLAVPLRMFEVFTSTNSMDISLDASHVIGSTLMYLVKRGYFQDLCMLISQKCPPLYGPSPNPPTPLCGALFDLIQRALALVSRVEVPNYDDIIMTEFASAFLCDPYPEPVEMFILPALANSQRFPFLPLIKCLRDDSKYQCRKLVNDTWLLHSVVTLEPHGFAHEILNIDNTKLPDNPILIEYLKVLAKLTVNMCNKQITYEYENPMYCSEAAEGDESDEEEPNPTTVREQMLLTKCIELLNDSNRAVMLTCTSIADNSLCDEFLTAMAEICHNLQLSHRMALHRYRVLYTLAFKPIFLRSLWRLLTSMSHQSSFGGSVTPLISALSRGMGADTTIIPVNKVLAPLAVFCSLFELLIGTLHDNEFCKGMEDEDGLNDSSSPRRTHVFDFSELGALCRTLRGVCIGLVELAYPETRSAFIIDQIKDAVGHSSAEEEAKKSPAAWSHLFKVTSHLIRALYTRDVRLNFFGMKNWAIEGVVQEAAGSVLAVTRAMRASRHGYASTATIPTTPRHPQEEGPPLTIKEQRAETILKEIPFIVPFATRVVMFQGLLQKEKYEFQFESNFNEGPAINISVRRTHLYEDAFDKLRIENEPDMRLKLRVQLINQVGAEEAGVDGGGLFREFLSELLKSAFDPNRGLFRLTRDNMLYPNPGVTLLYDNFPLHYFFVGRMLGKALYENLLVELPLAEFFIGKMCSTREAGIHALASLDPALYRGLLQLKTHRKEDVPDLGLDFTVVSDELGEQRIEELKPGGANIPVTAENRIEYIHLVADYKLNKQIRQQCAAFKRGISSVVNIDWMRMFSSKELQYLMSGAEVPIDLLDLRRNTTYGGGYSNDHPTVQLFWKVVETFNDTQRRQLLKFVTSCSRPPLLGFKDLTPSFCIHSAGSEQRLPSSSTCMNLLKLPEFLTEEVMAEKLLYAIQSGSGFELS